VLVLLGEDPGDRQRTVRERHEHVHGAAAVVEANAPEFGQTALRGAVVVFGGCFLVRVLTWLGFLDRCRLGLG